MLRCVCVIIVNVMITQPVISVTHVGKSIVYLWKKVPGKFLMDYEALQNVEIDHAVAVITSRLL